MGKPYPQELRDRVLSACDRGMKTRPVAKLFNVSPAWVRRVKQRRKETGETRPRPMGGATVIKIDMQLLRRLVQEQPDATVAELHRRLGVECSVSAVNMAIGRLGFTYKKNAAGRRTRSTGRR